VRDWGALHESLVPGFVTDTRLDGEDRIVTFFNGAIAPKRLIDLDDEHRPPSSGLLRRTVRASQRLGTGVRRRRRASRFVWDRQKSVPNAVSHSDAGEDGAGTNVVKQTLESRADARARRREQRGQAPERDLRRRAPTFARSRRRMPLVAQARWPPRPVLRVRRTRTRRRSRFVAPRQPQLGDLRRACEREHVDGSIETDCHDAANIRQSLSPGAYSTSAPACESCLQSGDRVAEVLGFRCR